MDDGGAGESMAEVDNFLELRLAEPVLLSDKFLVKGFELHDLISKGAIGDGADDFEHF